MHAHVQYVSHMNNVVPKKLSMQPTTPTLTYYIHIFNIIQYMLGQHSILVKVNCIILQKKSLFTKGSPTSISIKMNTGNAKQQGETQNCGGYHLQSKQRVQG